MGTSASSSLVEQLRHTELARVDPRVAAVSGLHCVPSPTVILVKISRKTMPSNATFQFVNCDNETEGELLFWIDRQQVLVTGQQRPTAKLLATSCRDDFQVVDAKTGTALFQLSRNLQPNEPAPLGTFRDRISGRAYTIGFTGDWSRRHTGVLWLSPADTQHGTPLVVAKVFPSRKTSLRLSYCVEVAPGIDRSLVALVCFVLDFFPGIASTRHGWMGQHPAQCG